MGRKLKWEELKAGMEVTVLYADNDPDPYIARASLIRLVGNEWELSCGYFISKAEVDGGELEAIEDSPADMGLDASYSELRRVLNAAYDQAATGKGNERHACGEPFQDQLICILGRQLGGTGFQVGQACKKAIESTRLAPDRAIEELKGAINYLAAAVILLEEKKS